MSDRKASYSSRTPLGDDDNFWLSVPDDIPTDRLSAMSLTEPSPSSASATSGEFNLFTLIGSSMSDGGGLRRGLWWSEDVGSDKLCLGIVGTSKVCCKRVIGSAVSCGTSKHDRVKFVLPKTPHAFIKFSDKSFLSDPALDLSAHGFTESQLADLRSAKMTQEAWLRFFQAPSAVNPEEEDASDNEVPEDGNEELGGKGAVSEKKKIRIVLPELLSPKHSDNNAVSTQSILTRPPVHLMLKLWGPTTLFQANCGL